MNKNLAVLSTVLYGFFVIAIVVGIVEVIFMASDPNFTVGNDPKVLAGAISQELVSAAIILIISPFTACMGAVILLFNRFRARWYFYWSLILSLPYALFFPFGTGVFAITWGYLFYHRKTFLNQADLTQQRYAIYAFPHGSWNTTESNIAKQFQPNGVWLDTNCDGFTTALDHASRAWSYPWIYAYVYRGVFNCCFFVPDGQIPFSNRLACNRHIQGEQPCSHIMARRHVERFCRECQPRGAGCLDARRRGALLSNIGGQPMVGYHICKFASQIMLIQWPGGRCYVLCGSVAVKTQPLKRTLPPNSQK